MLTNSNLELASLVLYDDTLLEVCPDANMTVPRSGSDNTPIVSWSTQEASTINPGVLDLLRICALHSIIFFLNPSVFYHLARRIAWRMTHLKFLN